MDSTLGKLIEKLTDTLLILWIYDSFCTDLPHTPNDIKDVLKDFSCFVSQALQDVKQSEDKDLKSSLILLSDVSEKDINLSMNAMQQVLKKLLRAEGDLIELDSPKTLKQKLKLIEDYINNVFLKIMEARDMNEAKIYFGSLEKIQTYVAKLAFRNDLKLDEYMFSFVRDFDRIDDSLTQKSIFQKIKHGNYSLLKRNPKGLKNIK